MNLPRSRFEIFQSAKGIVFLVVVLAAVFLSTLSWRSYQTAIQIDVNEAWVSALIIDKRTGVRVGGRSYFVTATFRFEDQPYQVTEKVPRAYFLGATIGDEVSVRISQQDPNVMEYVEGWHREQAKSSGGGGLLALCIGLGGLFWASRLSRSGVDVRANGKRDQAVIVDVGERAMRRGGKMYLMLRTVDGLTGQSLDHEPVDLQHLKIGDKVTVFVLGNDVWWEGDV